MLKIDAYDIDDQIKSIEKDIADLTQKLFESQGMLRLALHLKAQQDKERKNVASSPTR